MNDTLYTELQTVIFKHGNLNGFDFDTKEEATIYLCELILKRFAGYRISCRESGFLNSVPHVIRKDGRTPTERGSKLICNVYYNHPELQSDGCVVRKSTDLLIKKDNKQ